MAYLLEWNSHSSGDARSLVRQVRVFRSANGLKAFIRTRAFRKIASAELRVELRSRRNTLASAITTAENVLAWNTQESRLPAALQDSAWAKELRNMTVRASFLQNWHRDLQSAEKLGLLKEDQVTVILAALEIFLKETEQGRHSSTS